MARRGRSRKRDDRMDTAVRYVTNNFGFDAEDVRRVATQLLSEYAGDVGDEGWQFIIEGNYQLIVHLLLDEQELNAEQHNAPNPNQEDAALPQNIPLQGENVQEHTSAGAVKPSEVLAEASSSKVVENELERNDKVCSDQLPPSGRDGKDWKDIGLDQSSSPKDTAAGISDKDEIYGSSQECANSLILTPPSQTPATPRDSSVPSPPEICPILSNFPKIPPAGADTAERKRRQPCNGWIFESDEEEDEEMIELKPAIEWENVRYEAVKGVKRTSKWDLKPEDI